MNTRHRAGIIVLLAALVAGTAGGASPRRALAADGLSGTVTITDRGSYSDVSRVADTGSRMTCEETIAVHPDGSATETIDYTYHDREEQDNNGYQTTHTVDIVGSGSVTYDPQLYANIQPDGIYSLGFGTADPGIVARETVTDQQTGQQAQPPLQTTVTIHCQYDARLLEGRLGGGDVLTNTDTEDGHWNTEENHDDYGPSTVAWTITDPNVQSGQTSPGSGGPLPPPQVHLNGSVQIDDQGSYSANSSGQTITSRMNCEETIAVHRDGSATETIAYTYHEVSQQDNNGYQSTHSVDIVGSGTVQYDPELYANIQPDGTYYLGFGTADPGIMAQETATDQQTGQQAHTIRTLIVVDCQYDPGLLRGTLGRGPLLQIDVTKNGHWNTNEDHDDYGPLKLVVHVDDPNLAPGHGQGQGKQPKPTPKPKPQPTPSSGPSCSNADGGDSCGYVALGDSFSAGDGVAPPFVPGGARCHRAPGAYALLYDRNASFWACSGAQTANILVTGQNGEPAQISHLTPATRMVSLTIGGNDVRLFDALVTCLLYRVVRPCSSLATSRDYGTLYELNNRLAMLEPRLQNLFVQIARKAPHARIFVLGYPNPLPAHLPFFCTALSKYWIGRLQADDVSWFNGEIGKLNAAERQAAVSAGAHFVDTTPLFANHDVCSAQPWFNALGDTPEYHALHPNAAGNQQLAGLLLREAGPPPS
ncbi:MAG TPA: GDSL-type esterase/lipase family protein [Chloroflexota bacterium]|nr:GDSL-type esterase/lipase family protein [Chloroflexota bacterium]